MIKFLKTIFFVLLVLLAFSFHSCIDLVHNDVRTGETELNEISQTIANLKDAGYKIDTTASGMYVIIHKQGTGPFPQAGDTCFVVYASYTISGILLQTSSYYTDGIWEMVYKDESLIKGFDEAIGMMNKGMEADFIIPSKLAYGADGTDGIPPYSPLIFSINLKNLIQKEGP